MIIVPKKVQRLPDPFIAPVHGKRGPCALCSHYSDLTENHVPPRAVGNATKLVAQSYLTASTSNKDLYFGRHFANGLKFRTICRDCNSKLGGSEDKAIGSMYDRARKLVDSPLILTPTVKFAVKPNLIYRGLLAHLASANDQGYPTDFDDDARKAFHGKTPLRSCPWNLFYWTYLGQSLFVQRRAFLGITSPMRVIPMFILKYYPLGFVFTTLPVFSGLPNMKTYLQPKDDAEVDVPLRLDLVENNPVWPAVPGGNAVIFMGGDSFGLVAGAD